MKKTTASTPQDLAGANAAYCQRLGELARESQQRWLQLGQRLASDGTGQYLSTLAPLKLDGNWQNIAPRWARSRASNGSVNSRPARPSPTPRWKTRRRWPRASARR